MRDDPGVLALAEVPLGWEPVNECTRDGDECRALLRELAPRKAALVSHPDGSLQVWEERNPIWRD
jgi:hypothetical protein